MEFQQNGGVKVESAETDTEKIRRLEAQVFQLKNVIIKLTGQSDENREPKKKGRPFDFSLYCKRHVRYTRCGENFFTLNNKIFTIFTQLTQTVCNKQ